MGLDGRQTISDYRLAVIMTGWLKEWGRLADEKIQSHWRHDRMRRGIELGIPRGGLYNRQILPSLHG